MPASRSAADASNSMLYALVIFVVLFLAAAVFAVVMFMSNEKYRNERDTAQAELALIGNASERNAIKSLAKKQGARVTTTALSQLEDDMSHLASLIAGPEQANFPLTGARQKADASLGLVWPEVQRAFSNDPKKADPAVGLAGIIEALVKWGDEYGKFYLEAEEEKNNLLQRYQQEKKAWEDAIEQFKTDLDAARKLAQANQQKFEDLESNTVKRYEGIITRRDNSIKELEAEKSQLDKSVKELRETVAQHLAEVKDLRDKLKAFRPSGQMESAALEPDGKVLKVIPEDNLAYINLGRANRIYRGLTFSVYDSYQPIPTQGKGKGSIEVIEIKADIAKCRITDQDPSNPIMQNDVIANLVWNPEKKYLFCVAGDFDFDGDGLVDIDGHERVTNLIKAWGGRVTDKLSIDVAFLVLGRPPEIPPQPSEELVNTKAGERWRAATARADNYDQVLDNSTAFGVPTYNRERFLYFIGYYAQASQK